MIRQETAERSWDGRAIALRGTLEQCLHRTRAQEETTFMSVGLSQKLLPLGSWVSKWTVKIPMARAVPAAVSPKEATVALHQNLKGGQAFRSPRAPCSSPFLLYGFPSSRPALVTHTYCINCYQVESLCSQLLTVVLEKPGWQDYKCSLASSPALRGSRLLWDRSHHPQC